MKFRSLFLSALCALTVVAGFTSCNDNDEIPAWKEGATVELPQYRAFILSEGSMNANNSHLFFINPETDEPYQTDIFEAQNGIKLGDTANDIITENGDIYVLMNVSEVLYRLNGSGVIQAIYNGFEADQLGQPRSMVEEDGKIYVTCYGGYVARFDAKTLKYEAKVQTDANPEEIVEHDGILYCVNSGYGLGHTMSIIDTKKFDKAESAEIPSNPFGLKEDDGHIYIMAYNADYTTSVYTFDTKTKKYDKIADASRMLPVKDKLYLGNTVNKGSWVSPDYETTFSVYDTNTRKTAAWNLTNVPEALKKNTVYMIERNPYDGSFYIATADYVSNSPVYHFTADGNFKSTFNAGGINANAMVFLR
ncbi:MAG: hypothetical protein IJV27_12255 [Prevotella sp.]|nr:hypothetical protein [Prevotella sp.]